MRPIATVSAAAMLCAGCALGSDETEQAEGQTGELVGAGTYFDPFSSPNDRRIGPLADFKVAEGGSVTVTMAPRWKPTGPGYKCSVPAIFIGLYKHSPKIEAMGQQPFSTWSGTSTGAWRGLHAGTYALILHTENDNPHCVLTGNITIKVTS